MACATASLALLGCAVPAQMLAAPDDYADYREFRVATGPGKRLARAQAYLERHPRGQWVDEVRAAFDSEEDAWFEAAKASRSRARDYIVDLPRGPHAEAAKALLVLFDQREADIDTLELLAAWRRTSVALDLESSRRRRVGEVVLEEVAVLVDPSIVGADLDDPPHALSTVLRGATTRTWGVGRSGIREDEIYFALPTPSDDASLLSARVAEVRFQVTLERGRVRGGMVEGEDLFVRWVEANEVRVLDASSSIDREAAAASVLDLLSGAIEARLPASRCAAVPAPGEIMARACDGWRVSVRMGAGPGAQDVILVRAGE